MLGHSLCIQWLTSPRRVIRSAPYAPQLSSPWRNANYVLVGIQKTNVRDREALKMIASDQLLTVSHRIRASRPRVKTGCGVCRKRRIKCDETKPACGGCVRSGWKCDGYSLSATHEGLLAIQSGSCVSLNISSYSIPFQVPGSKRDRELLHYFCTQAASDISGFVSSEFWTKTVLQASHHESVVRQALLALSSLHLDYISSDAPGSQFASIFTIQRYGKCVKSLRKRLDNNSSNVVRIALICSILLYSFESMLGNSNSALKQLGGGLSILKSMQRSNYRELAEPDSIVDTFARLDIQATMFDDSHPPTLTLTPLAERQNPSMAFFDVPFQSVEVASKELVKVQNWLFQFLISSVSWKFVQVNRIPMSILLEKTCLDQQLRSWYMNCTTLTTEYRGMLSSGLSILIMHYHISRMLLASSFPENDAIFGASPNILAEDVMEIAEDVLGHVQQQNSSAITAKNPRRNFSAEAGVIAPLTLLIVKCADASIVQRATRVLTLLRRQEGLYDTKSLLSVTQHLDHVKEARKLNSTELSDIPLSLEHWVQDIVNGAPAGMEADDRLVPPTILPTPGGLRI